MFYFCSFQLNGVFFLVLVLKLGEEGQDLVPRESNRELSPKNMKYIILSDIKELSPKNIKCTIVSNNN